MTSQTQDTPARGKLGNISLDRHLLDELAGKGVISPELRQASLDWLHPPRAWAHWAMVLMLAFGTGLILSGIIFFFAFNWASIPDLAKLGMIEAGLILAAFCAWYVSLERLSGRLLLLVSATLVGVFLATFGQIYQSGADPWELFALWALLIAPWTFVARLSALWLVWWLLVNLALFLWWEETLGNRSAIEPYFYFAFTLLNGAALVLREWLVRSGGEKQSEQVDDALSWLAPVWTRWLLVAATLACLFPLLIGFVTDLASGDGIVSIVAPLGALILAAIYAYYRFVIVDIPVLAMALLVVCLLFVIGVAVLLDSNDADALITTLLTGIAAIGTFGAAAGRLRKLLATEASDKEEETHG